MATTHHNISGELTQELLAVGDGVNVTSISLVNIHASTTCTVDLYIEKQLTGNDVKFSNKANQFGLYIKLTQGASETPTVDVIIS